MVVLACKTDKVVSTQQSQPWIRLDFAASKD